MMKITRIPSLKTIEQFREYVAGLGLDLQAEDSIATGEESPLTQPLQWSGRTIGNRWTVHPMEGWDSSLEGGASESMKRRWMRFGLSGGKLIWGGEAMAVVPEARSNPNQLMICDATKPDIAMLRDTVVNAHKERYSRTDDLVIGFQLTHSGRFSRPNDMKRHEPLVAYRHPILDRKFHVSSDSQVVSDDYLKRLVETYAKAARIAADCGADFVDVKHCHGYLLHEILGAHTRPGEFGGSFENRTRMLRDIVAATRAAAPSIGIGVRLSAFDFVPFRPDPALTSPGKLGPGIPEDFSACLPYRYGFGANPHNPIEYDLTETVEFLRLCEKLGVTLLNLSAGSPYYNPHVGRPASYPPSDGYQPPEEPLVGCARQINVVKALKAQFPSLIMVGTAYSYLQEYLPHVAQHYLRHGHVDSVGIGRAVLSYPDMLADATTGGRLQSKHVCRTFSDCTTAPRNGLPSGCYPLDEYYKNSPSAPQMKAVKKSGAVL